MIYFMLFLAAFQALASLHFGALHIGSGDWSYLIAGLLCAASAATFMVMLGAAC